MSEEKRKRVLTRMPSRDYEPNWNPLPKDHPVLRKMNSITIQSYRPKLISENRRMIEDLCRDLVVNNDHIHIVELRLRAAIAQGLARDTHEEASVKCYPTYVRHLPTGQERGRFLALDLGGTNFRVLLVEIGENQHFCMESKVFAIPKEIMVGSGAELFDHIAHCLVTFVEDLDIIDEDSLPLGFTFSFPCQQEGLAKGRLTKWTKGFNCEGVEGQDVVHLLNEAIERLPSFKMKINVCAILNDTTGCLMSCAWKESKCRIGLILGTGTNACYLENISDIQTLDHHCGIAAPTSSASSGDGDNNAGRAEEPKHMIVNTEWGAFGDHGELDFISTKWDAAVDAGSLNPGKQRFEKMISGMYMGELVRQVLLDMVSEGLIFNNLSPDEHLEPLFQWGSFLTRYVSEIESDPVGEFSRARDVFFELFGPGNRVTDEDCSAVRYICECVSRRAGFMAAAGITALLKRMDYKDVVVAIDGSVFRYHPHFANIMKSRIGQLMGIDYKFDLMLSTDGSGRGAALVAAVLNNTQHSMMLQQP